MARPKASAHIDPQATDLASIIARTMLRCTRCKGMKPMTKDFFRFKPSTGRFNSRCLLCQCQVERDGYSRNRTEVLQRKKSRRDGDVVGVAKRRRAYYEKTRDRHSHRAGRRYHENPTLRLRVIFRTRFAKVLQGKGGQSWQEIGGYTADELRRHIEALLPPTWSWSNYGTVWVIDHKKPIAAFDLPRQVKECWALSNLRPLEKMENHRKGAIILGEFA